LRAARRRPARIWRPALGIHSHTRAHRGFGSTGLPSRCGPRAYVGPEGPRRSAASSSRGPRRPPTSPGRSGRCRPKPARRARGAGRITVSCREAMGGGGAVRDAVRQQRPTACPAFAPRAPCWRWGAARDSYTHAHCRHRGHAARPPVSAQGLARVNPCGPVLP